MQVKKHSYTQTVKSNVMTIITYMVLMIMFSNIMIINMLFQRFMVKKNLMKPMKIIQIFINIMVMSIMKNRIMNFMIQIVYFALMKMDISKKVAKKKKMIVIVNIVLQNFMSVSIDVLKIIAIIKLVMIDKQANL